MTFFVGLLISALLVIGQGATDVFGKDDKGIHGSIEGDSKSVNSKFKAQIPMVKTPNFDMNLQASHEKTHYFQCHKPQEKSYVGVQARFKL